MDHPELFQKKPIAVEAMQFDGTLDSASKIVKWIISNGGTANHFVTGLPSDTDTRPKRKIVIMTLEGLMGAFKSDYIIRGAVGEFYPCKEDVFALTYQRAQETEDV